MDSERYVNLACQQGFVSKSGLRRAREQQRAEAEQGRHRSLWEILREQGIVSVGQARDVEAACEAARFDDGFQVEGYRIVERIGSGGMGDVYLGEPIAGDGPQVAIKMLPRRLCADPEHLQRFVRETRALAQVEDEHVTRFISSGQVDGRPYLIMELVRGVSLKERLQQQGALRQREAVVILAQLSGALIKAEDMRVVHRDLKPANILISPPRPGTGEPFCAKICDFGLVKFLQDRAESIGVDEGLTMSGIALGTPHYMSPEQATGERIIDHRSDMYSLAASVYHAMMGRTLFSGKTSAVIMYKQVTAAIDVEPLRDRGCDDELIELLRKMLHKEPGERPASWRDIYAASTSILDRMPGTTSSDGQAAEPAAASLAIDVHCLPSPVPGMPEGIYRSRRRATWAIMVAGLCVLAVLASAALIIAPPGGGQRLYHAQVGTLETVLQQIVADRQAAPERQHSDSGPGIVLAPGEYTLALELGPEHRGLRLLSAGRGVIIDGGLRPAVTLRSGAKDIVMRGPLTLRSSGLRSLVVESDAAVLAQEVSLSGGDLVAEGGSLTLEHSRILSSIEVSAGSQLVMRDSAVIDSPRGIRGRGALVVLKRVGVFSRAELETPFAWFTDCSLSIEGLQVHSPAAHTALHTESCSWVELQQVSLRARNTAWRSDESVVGLVAGLTMYAEIVGLRWQGRFDPQWRWQDFSVQAPQPAAGLDIGPMLGVGINPDVLRSIPQPLHSASSSSLIMP